MPGNKQHDTNCKTVEETTADGIVHCTELKNAAEQQSKEPTSEEVSMPNYQLSTFKLARILQNNTLRKTIALVGTFPNISETDAAVVLLEKQAFKESDVQTASELNTDGPPRIFSDSLQVHTEFINNIYGSFQCIPSSKLNGIKTTVVYPATEKHIEKYSVTQKYLISETPTLYEQLTLPFITNSQFSLEWVYNILDHRQETERIVYEDADPVTGFVLLPDLKWDGKTLETLYLLAIVHKRDIKSLRDLNANHLPLLRKLRDSIITAIEKRYGLCGSQLRMYFHYQPSFYHLHVHINPVRSDAPGIWCEKSHMLDTVISNIELMSDYYQRVTLPFVLFEGSKLLDEYESKEAIRKEVTKAKEEKILNEEEQVKESEALYKPPAKKLKLAELEAVEPPAKKLKEVAETANPPTVLEIAAE
ncbi:m7GpppX diphosphatase [Eurosta solidaginis]|uniref:m7GpppX diphosphatase n=1 Tax=Eurosta solidaginis TaxID=178769 RepID=UPI0035312C3D